MVTFIKSKKFLLILLLLFFISSSTALALEVDWPISPGGTLLNDDSDVGDMVQYFYEWAIALGGLATFFSLTLGGFKYLSSMGRPEAMKEARDQITSAFLGLALLLSSWLILNLINPDLTEFKRSSYSLSYHMERISFNLGETSSCDYVVFYESDGKTQIETTGGETEILPNSEKVYLTTVPISVRAYLAGEECREDGCGCSIKISLDGKPTYGGEIGEAMDGDCDAEVIRYHAYYDDIPSLTDDHNKDHLRCAEVKGGGCNACYEKNAEGRCAYQGDTGWGDDKYLCKGRDRRCFNNECITCKGVVMSDGCSGCTAPTGSTSTLACWYAGRSGDMANAPNCNEVCSKKEANCIQEQWNDYDEIIDGVLHECVVGRTLWSCEHCGEWSFGCAPYYYNFLGADTCYIRDPDGRDQDCGEVGSWYSRRFCVCTK